MKYQPKTPEKKPFRYAVYCYMALLCYVVWSSLLVAGCGAEPLLRIGYAKNFMEDVEIRDANAAFNIFVKEFGIPDNYRAERTTFEDGDAVPEAIANNRLDFAIAKTLALAVTILRIEGRTPRDIAGAEGQPGDTSQKSSAQASYNTMQFGSGMIFMNALLTKNKLPDTERFFSVIGIKNKSTEAVNEVHFRQADACLVSESFYGEAVSLNQQIAERLMVIASSPPLVEYVTVFRKDCPEKQKEQIPNEILNLKNTVRGKQFLILLRCDDMVRITEADLAETLKFMQESARLEGKRQ